MKRFSRVKFSFIWISLLIGLVWLVSGCEGQQPAAQVVTPSIGEPKVGAPSPQQPGEEIGISIEIASTGGVNLNYTWTADGGEIVRGQGSPAITYRVPQDPGTYNIRVKVEWEGQSVEKVTSVKVEGANEAPTPAPPTDTPQPPVDSPTPKPSDTPEPTNTPKPPTATPTPKATNTPKPTNTPRPTPIPTATIDADPTVYDNFNNPAFEGSLNQSRWNFHNPQGACDATQQEGIMIISMSSSNNAGECYLFTPQEVSGSRLQLFEARLQTSSNVKFSSGGSLFTSIVMSSNGFSGGGGWVSCGLLSTTGGIDAVFSISKENGAVEEYYRASPAEYDQWHTFRYEVDPSTMTISCFMNDNMIGSAIPEDAAELKTASFGRYIQTYLHPNSSATTFVDDVRVVP